jgi:hypothetical protein
MKNHFTPFVAGVLLVIGALTGRADSKAEGYSADNILPAPSFSWEEQQRTVQAARLAQNLFAAKQTYQELAIFDQLLKIYPAWFESGRTNDQHRKIGVAAGDWITVAEMNAWLKDRTNSPEDIWAKVYWDTLLQFPADCVIDNGALSGSWLRDLPQKDALGNNFGPFFVGKSPWVPAATKEICKDVVPEGFWGQYENGPEATPAPAVASAEAPAPQTSPVASAPSDEQVRVANQILREMERINVDLTFYIQNQQQELSNCHRIYDPWEKNMRPVLAGKIHRPASEVAADRKELAEKKAHIDKLEANTKPGTPITIGELNDYLLATGNFKQSGLNPCDPLGHNFGPFIIGKTPWVPPASLAMLSEMGHAFWKDYDVLPNNGQAPESVPFKQPDPRLIENAIHIYFDYALINYAIGCYLDAVHKYLNYKTTPPMTAEEESKWSQCVAPGNQLTMDDLAAGLKRFSLYRVNLPSPTDPLTGSTYGPFVVGQPLRVTDALKKQCSAAVQDDFWQGYK